MLLILNRIMLIILISATIIGCAPTGKIITDSKTGLQWASAPESDTNWFQAKDYASGLKLGGFSDWRLPTRMEVQGLYNNGIDPTILNVSDKWVWTSEIKEPSFAWYINFHNGIALAYPCGNSYLNRVLAVRSPNKLK
jgi:hypothetical protein